MEQLQFNSFAKSTEMDEIISPEQWNYLKRKLKQKYPELTDSDLQYHESREQDMLKMVDYNLHKNKMKKRIMAGRKHCQAI